MLLRQIEYFQAIVRCGSFTDAAEECHISQSAISQQMKQLEDELGFSLLERGKRRFTLTEAGKLFYERSLKVTKEIDRMIQDCRVAASNDKAVLRLAWIKDYEGSEFMVATGEFARRYPQVDIQVRTGTHEEIHEWLRNEEIDLALNDQRRAFSNEYNNLILTEKPCFVETHRGSSIGDEKSIAVNDLGEETLIVVTTETQEENDRRFYEDYYGFKGKFIFAYSLEEAKLLALAGKGVLIIEGGRCNPALCDTLACIPLYRDGKRVNKRYCAFWKKDNSGYYVEEFADILKAQFREKQDDR